MSKFTQTLISILVILLIGMGAGWFWRQSLIPQPEVKPPTYITNTQYVTKYIYETQTVTVTDTMWVPVQGQDSISTFVVWDSVQKNSNDYDFLGGEDEAKISFTVETVDSIKVFLETSLDNSHLKYSESSRITNFLYVPPKPQVIIQNKTAFLQMYGGMNALVQKQETDNIINDGYKFTPSIGVDVIIGQKYKLYLGGQLDGFSVGVGMKLLEI